MIARWFVAVVALGLSVVGARPSKAFVCKRSEAYSYVSLHWDTRVIKWALQEGTPVDPAIVAPAFSAWSDVPCTDVRFEWASSTGFVPVSRSDVNQVSFVASGWKARGGAKKGTLRDEYAIAMTLTTYLENTGRITRANIEVNQDNFKVADLLEEGLVGGQCPSSDTMDLVSVLTHEVGHLLGLDHTQAVNEHQGGAIELRATMAALMGPCEVWKRSLAEDDKAGLCSVYPSGEPAVQCEDLPAQTESYVSALPFGCAASRDRASRSWNFGDLIGFGALFWLMFRRWRAPTRCACKSVCACKADA